MKTFSRKFMTLLSVLLLAFGFYQCKEPRESKETESIPRIVHMGKNEATISWDSKEKMEGVIYYKNAEKVKGRPTSGKDTRESSHHSVVISDLSPSTLYSYWIKESKTKYTFRTEPENDSPFSFLISPGDSPENESSLVKSENCGFMITLIDNKDDHHESANAFAPVFHMDGNNPDLNEEANPLKFWTLDYGGVRFIMINDQSKIGSFVNNTGNNPLGIILNSGIISNQVNELKQSVFHQNVIKYNKQNTHPVLFVGIIDYPEKSVLLDEISYFSIPGKPGDKTNSQQGNGVVVSIDGQAVSAYYPAEDKEIIIKIPAPNSRRTCIECNRLAKKGQYEESIDSYRKFIETYQGHYQVDQAYLSIAKIYDEKLFHFTEAQKWYKNFVDSFPEGTNRHFAMQRLAYYSSYSDCNFIPLEKFEQIRKKYSDVSENTGKQQKQRIHLNKKQQKLVAEAEEVNHQFSSCNTVPLITLWLADQYQQCDLKKALKYYYLLEAKFPEFSLDHEVKYKIAESWSLSGKYGKAKLAFTEVKKILPQLSEKVDTEVTRLNVKIKRATLEYISWGIFIILLVTAICLRPLGLKCPRFKIMLFVTLGFIYSFIMFFIASREEIAEDFNSSYKEIILFFVSFIIITALSMVIAKTYTAKLYRSKMIRAKIIGGLLSVFFFICSFYLILFYIYEQYLSFVKL